MFFKPKYRPNFFIFNWFPEQKASGTVSSSARRSMGLYMWRRPEIDMKNWVAIQQTKHHENLFENFPRKSNLKRRLVLTADFFRFYDFCMVTV